MFPEDPAELIQTCIANFALAPDKASLSRSTSSLATLSTARSHQLQKHKTGLAGLARQLATLQSTHALATQSHSAAGHAAEMLRLDTDKFRIAKEASDAEIEGERLAKEMDGVRRVLAEVEEAVERGDVRGPGSGGAAKGGVGVLAEKTGAGVGPSAGAGVDDEVLLKLKVYRLLPIDVEPDPETGLYSKAVVRNARKGDVHVVKVDPKFSRYFYANYFWDKL